MRDMKRFNAVSDCLMIINKQLEMLRHVMPDEHALLARRVNTIEQCCNEMGHMFHDMYNTVDEPDEMDDILEDVKAMDKDDFSMTIDVQEVAKGLTEPLQSTSEDIE